MADMVILLLDYKQAQSDVQIAEEHLEKCKEDLFRGLIEHKMIKYIGMKAWKIDDLRIEDIEAGNF